MGLKHKGQLKMTMNMNSGTNIPGNMKMENNACLLLIHSSAVIRLLDAVLLLLLL